MAAGAVRLQCLCTKKRVPWTNNLTSKLSSSATSRSRLTERAGGEGCYGRIDEEEPWQTVPAAAADA